MHVEIMIITIFHQNWSQKPNFRGNVANQGILPNQRYTQFEFKLKFSTLLKANDDKFTENSKNMTF